MKYFLLIVLLNISLSSAEKIRQCTCEEQQKCIDEVQEEIEGCLDECEVTADLKSTINESTNVGPCMEKRKTIILDVFDCLDSQFSQKESCLKVNAKTGENSEQQKVDAIDFDGLLVKYLRPIAEKTINQFKEINKALSIDFVNVAIEMNKCSQECAFKKITSLNCLDKQKCGLKVTENEVKAAFNQCLKQTRGKKKMMQICQCFSKNGVKNLDQFCHKLEQSEILEKI